jgi:hypothetical protein
VLKWAQDVPSFPHAPFSLAALFLRYAPDRFLLTKPNTSSTIDMPASLRFDGVRVHPGMPFGFAGIIRKSRIYFIGGAGSVDVWQQKDPDHCDWIARFPAAPGARTGFFLPDWGKLFVAVPHRGQQAAEIFVFETK